MDKKYKLILIGQRFPSGLGNLFERDYPNIYLDIVGESREGEIDREYLLEADLLILGNLKMKADLDKLYEGLFKGQVDLPVVALGKDLVEKAYTNCQDDVVDKVNTYFSLGGLENMKNMILYLLATCCGSKYEFSQGQIIAFNGIIHWKTDQVFENLSEYMDWYRGDYTSYVGILTHRSRWINDNLHLENSLIKELEGRGIGVITAFSYSIGESSLGVLDFEDIIENYFSLEAKLKIDLLVNMQMLQPLKGAKGETNVFDQAIENYKLLDIPILKALVSYHLTEEEWRKSELGLNRSGSNPFYDMERTGMVEAMIIGAVDEDGNIKAIESRLGTYGARIYNWIKLRKKKNKDKKVTIMLHSYPCIGVENNLGMGAGLDVFQSVLEIMKELKSQSYRLENIPNSAEELLDLFLEKKAHSDFRWTSVEDIEGAGGVLYAMKREEYEGLFDKLPVYNKEDMEKTWGKAPGQSMVLDDNILITGLNFGNVELMIQPKRGCYGAKCTGEVCKILHDPVCPPTYQFIASYRYIEDIYKADCLIHLGTAGSLELLPGKANALSENCYTDICLASLINLYIYNCSALGESLGARRRSNALLIGHLPGANKINSDYLKLIDSLDEYLARPMDDTWRGEILRDQLFNHLGDYREAFNWDLEQLEDRELLELRNKLLQQVKRNGKETKHIFGQIPLGEIKSAYIREYLESNDSSILKLKKSLDYDLYLKKVEDLIDGNLGNRPVDHYNKDIGLIYKGLEGSKNEMASLLKALNGQYVPSGLGGLPSDDLRKILPSGRNFYGGDTDKIPTRSAYNVGIKMTDILIGKYIEDKGEMPKKIALNMISTDISGSKGELLSQLLYLIGTRPIWRENGIVDGIEIIDLEELKRPRIDVVLKISGVLRDNFPEIIEFIDEALELVGDLDESPDENYVIKYNLENQKKLSRKDNLNARTRIFGNRPGSYGSGLDLMLKASAWEGQEDFAKTFVQYSSYGYGKNISGVAMYQEFIENVKNIDMSYEKTSSSRYGILSSSYTSSIHGGLSNLKEHLTGDKISSYYGNTTDQKLSINTIDDEISQDLDRGLLNPIYKSEMLKGSYLEANEIMKSFQKVYNWKALTNSISDEKIDDLFKQYVDDKKTYEWFKKYNYYGLEEIIRRFMELKQRKIWKPEEEIYERLKEVYLKIEGDLESLSEDNKGEFQAMGIELVKSSDVEEWNEKLLEVEGLLKSGRLKKKTSDL